MCAHALALYCVLYVHVCESCVVKDVAKSHAEIELCLYSNK